MERHLVDHPRAGETGRLARYLKHERLSRVRGPHHAVTVLRRLPRGSGEISGRARAYLQLGRRGQA